MDTALYLVIFLMFCFWLLGKIIMHKIKFKLDRKPVNYQTVEFFKRIDSTLQILFFLIIWLCVYCFLGKPQMLIIANLYSFGMIIQIIASCLYFRKHREFIEEGIICLLDKSSG